MELIETKLAIVLLDLIGPTRFVQSAGAMKAAMWLQRHDRLTRSLIYKFNGREIDRSDGFLLSFERPIDAVNLKGLLHLKLPLCHLIAKIEARRLCAATRSGRDRQARSSEHRLAALPDAQSAFAGA